jgi:hypothetical protein
LRVSARPIGSGCWGGKNDVSAIHTALEIETFQLFSADPTLEAALEHLYQTVAHDIERVVAEAIQKALSAK